MESDSSLSLSPRVSVCMCMSLPCRAEDAVSEDMRGEWLVSQCSSGEEWIQQARGLGLIMRPDILSMPEAQGSEITHGRDSASTVIIIPRHTYSPVVTPSVSGRF